MKIRIYFLIAIFWVFFGISQLIWKRAPLISEENLFQKGEEKKTHADFSFLSQHTSFPFPDIDKTILPLAFNTRPDASYPPEVLIQVENSFLSISSGQKVYLSFENGISLSPFPTSLSLKNEVKEDGSIEMEVGVKVLESEKKNSFRFEDLKRDVTIAEAISLKEGDILGPDCLLELYGGREYQKKKGKMRLKSLEGHLLFIQQGDLLSFKEGKWVLGSQKNLPLAQVLSINPSEVQFKVWDVSGLNSESFKVSSQKSAPPLPQPATLFTKLKRKTATKVSCRLGQKTVILKKGDWLIRTKSGWRPLTTAKEISDCIHYKLQGELFICDGIEKNQFTGTFFNEVRTVSQKIRLPFGEGKKK
ncbi:MAG: hypothetical protein KBC64_03205 [Simkaniaceae bacterium]|nr:hypothetical protein [Simkaniaceae bacterium]